MKIVPVDFGYATGWGLRRADTPTWDVGAQPMRNAESCQCGVGKNSDSTACAECPPYPGGACKMNHLSTRLNSRLSEEGGPQCESEMKISGWMPQDTRDTRMKMVKTRQQIGHSRVEEEVETRILPLKPLQVVDFPHLAEKQCVAAGWKMKTRNPTMKKSGGGFCAALSGLDHPGTLILGRCPRLSYCSLSGCPEQSGLLLAGCDDGVVLGIVPGMNAVFVEFVAKGADADAEQFGGVGAVLGGFFEDGEDVAFLEFGERKRAVICRSPQDRPARAAEAETADAATGGGALERRGEKPRCSGSSMPLSPQRMTARSMTFCSSRTLPGQ